MGVTSHHFAIFYVVEACHRSCPHSRRGTTQRHEHQKVGVMRATFFQSVHHSGHSPSYKVKEGSNKGIFEQWSEWSKRTHHIDIWWEIDPGRGNGKFKGHEAKLDGVQEASMAGAEWAEGRGIGDKLRGRLGSQIMRGSVGLCEDFVFHLEWDGSIKGFWAEGYHHLTWSGFPVEYILCEETARANGERTVRILFNNRGKNSGFLDQGGKSGKRVMRSWI